MPVFDPAQPATDSELKSAPVRENFIALKALIDDLPAGPPGPQGPQGPAGSVTWGFNWQGTWNAQVYGAGCVVLFEGVLYLATQMCGPDAPGVDPRWQQLSIIGPAGQAGTNGNDGAPGPQGEVSASDLNNALGSTSANTNGVATLDTPMSDPDMETLRQKMNELIGALRR